MLRFNYSTEVHIWQPSLRPPTDLQWHLERRHWDWIELEEAPRKSRCTSTFLHVEIFDAHKMDTFLSRINASINAVDIQLEFERMVALIHKANGKDGFALAVQSTVGDFLRMSRPTDAHAQYIVDTISPLLSSPALDVDVHECIDLLVSLSSVRGKACTKLIDSPAGEFTVWSLVQHEDEFVKLGVVKLLRNLLKSSPSVMASQLLARPEVLADLVDSTRLGISSDFVRNESISFLFEVSQSSASQEIYPILAYQGISDSIFHLLMEDEHGVVTTEVTFQAMQCLVNLCSNALCCRYIRESGGCQQVTAFFEFALAPIFDHAQGFASEEDPETMENRIRAAWVQASRVLDIAEQLMDSSDTKSVFVSNGLVQLVLVCGESLSLADEARARCYRFMARMVDNSPEIAELFTAPSETSPVLWRLFSVLIEERTPLVVRFAIDEIVANVCESSELVAERLASMLGPSASLDSEDSMTAYLNESPSKMASAILQHASGTVQFRIPDDSALAHQVWFTVSAVGHMTSRNIELQRAVANMRITEEASMMSVLKKLVLNSSLSAEQEGKDTTAEIVKTGALSLLAELVTALPSAAVSFLDIETAKVLTDSVCEHSSSIAAVVVGVLMLVLPDGMADPLVAAIEGRIGLVTFFKLLEVRAGTGLTLPCSTAGFARVAAVVKPSIQKQILERHLGVSPVDSEKELRAVIRHQAVQLEALEDEVATAVDLSVSRHASRDFLVDENERLRSLVHQLKREVKIGEAEIARLKLKSHVETTTMKTVINDLNQQVQALLVAYQQSSELTGTTPGEAADSTHGDLLELLQLLKDRFPETASLIGPLGLTSGGNL